MLINIPLDHTLYVCVRVCYALSKHFKTSILFNARNKDSLYAEKMINT